MIYLWWFQFWRSFASFQPFQEHDMSVELYNQHTAISELQQVEDEMIDQLKLMAEFSSKFVPELMDMCRMTNDVDYDQDGEICRCLFMCRLLTFLSF